MYTTQRKNLLDIYRVQGRWVGLFREAFERVIELEGFQLIPVNGKPEVWEFRNPGTGQRGRLLSVPGVLTEDPVSVTTKGRAYMITRQDFTLALLMPGAPRRIRLSETRHRVLPKDGKRVWPAHWPEELVARVIKVRWRTVVILDEGYLLRRIGLRGAL